MEEKEKALCTESLPDSIDTEEREKLRTIEEILTEGQGSGCGDHRREDASPGAGLVSQIATGNAQNQGLSIEGDERKDIEAGVDSSTEIKLESEADHIPGGAIASSGETCEPPVDSSTGAAEEAENAVASSTSETGNQQADENSAEFTEQTHDESQETGEQADGASSATKFFVGRRIGKNQGDRRGFMNLRRGRYTFMGRPMIGYGAGHVPFDNYGRMVPSGTNHYWMHPSRPMVDVVRMRPYHSYIPPPPPPPPPPISPPMQHRHTELGYASLRPQTNSSGSLGASVESLGVDAYMLPATQGANNLSQGYGYLNSYQPYSYQNHMMQGQWQDSRYLTKNTTYRSGSARLSSDGKGAYGGWNDQSESENKYKNISDPSENSSESGQVSQMLQQLILKFSSFNKNQLAIFGQTQQNMWYYVDMNQTTQGPYDTLRMSQWFVAGYFRPETLVKRGDEQEFTKLGDGYRLYDMGSQLLMQLYGVK